MIHRNNYTFSNDAFPFFSHRTGKTKSSEDGAPLQTIHVFSMDPVDQLGIQGPSTGNYTTIMAVDRLAANARSEFDESLRLLERGSHQLFVKHAEAWEKVWAEGSIEIEGDKQLAKITTFSQYYLFSSLPTLEAHQPPRHEEFLYGVARDSLAKGERGKDYQGHIMWDSEVNRIELCSSCSMWRWNN